MRRIYQEPRGFLPSLLEGEGLSLPPGAGALCEEEQHAAHVFLMDKSLPPGLYQMISPSAGLTPGPVPGTRGALGFNTTPDFQGKGWILGSGWFLGFRRDVL